MRKLVGALVFSAMVMALPDAARAATITLDFTSALYGGANGVGSFSTTDQGVGVNVQSGPMFSTINHLPEGLGVNFPLLPDDTELGLLETLTVNFLTPQFIDSASFQLLFNNQREQERGTYSINGGAPVTFFATSPTGNLTLLIGQDAVSQIQFQAPRFADDYTLSSINLTAVPEPTSMILLGTGLLFGARRRFKTKQQQ